MRTDNHPPDDTNPKQAVTFLTIILSVLASFIGIQTNANRERDFASGNLWYFVAAGIVFVLLLIGVLWGAVRILLATA